MSNPPEWVDVTPRSTPEAGAGLLTAARACAPRADGKMVDPRACADLHAAALEYARSCGWLDPRLALEQDVAMAERDAVIATLRADVARARQNAIDEIVAAFRDARDE